MANKLFDPEWKTQLRRREVQKLKFSVSFDRVLPRETVSPTYRYEFDVLDDAIKVTKSTTGKSGARSIVGVDRNSSEMSFYMAEMDFPWTDRWMAENRAAGTLPVPIQTLVSPQRAASLMMADVLRELDTDFYTQLVAQDASASSIGANDVTTPDGRQAFIETLNTLLGTMSTTFVEGRPVLAIDRAALFHFGMPFAYTDGTGTATPGGAGPTLASLIRENGIEIVPVNNPVLAGKALLHYQEIDNASFLHSTPSGVEVLWGMSGDNEVLRVFHHAGFVAYRDNAVVTHTSVLEDLL